MALVATLAVTSGLAAQNPAAGQREEFTRAWQAAARGDRAVFQSLKPGLQDYLLYPYLQYEDLRYRRGKVDPAEMASFLNTHDDWAFTGGLRTAWLRTTGKNGNWDALIQYAGDPSDTEVRCYLAQARIRNDLTDGMEEEARKLWAVGKSQPEACDPVFAWLQKQGGITPGLAWERIRLAMEARQPRLTIYLARFVAEEDRVWVDRWQQQDRSGYHRLDRASGWEDQAKSRDITDYGIRRLARSDPDRAWEILKALDGPMQWGEDRRGGILREVALWSAVDGVAGTPERMRAVPESMRDDQLLEWWARFDLGRGRWDEVVKVIGAMSPEQRDDSRWRYWEARSLLESGNREAGTEKLEALSREANYYGFLAADQLDHPYTICPQEPEVDPAQVDALAARTGFDRSLELREAGIRNWSRSEWKLASKALDRQGLRVAAALAVRENWPDMAIFALGDSGDLRWYEWRFPVEYGSLVAPNAEQRNLDPSWVMGLMRSESAMAPDAVSSAGALGLMQVMPGTARQLSRRHSISYSGKSQLLQPETNIRFGTAFLGDLMERYNGSEALASGAYNAGPHVVDRWVADRQTSDPAIWIDTLPYFETRDYIPRVLAFSTIYDWRLQQPVRRVSTRMPSFDSGATKGTMQSGETAEVVCTTPG